MYVGVDVLGCFGRFLSPSAQCIIIGCVHLEHTRNCNVVSHVLLWCDMQCVLVSLSHYCCSVN